MRFSRAESRFWLKVTGKHLDCGVWLLIHDYIAAYIIPREYKPFKIQPVTYVPIENNPALYAKQGNFQLI